MSLENQLAPAVVAGGRRVILVKYHRMKIETLYFIINIEHPQRPSLLVTRNFVSETRNLLHEAESLRSKGRSASHKTSCHLCALKVHCRAHNNPPLDPILRWTKPVDTLELYPF
jgi:hypothetical protein